MVNIFCLIGILLLTRCARKLNGQHQTNFGALAAYEVPFFVIPDRFGTKYAKQLPGNNVSAVIW